MFAIPAIELKAAKISHFDYMLVKTNLELMRVKYLNGNSTQISFVSHTNEDVCMWKEKMQELGYKIRDLDSQTVNIRSYEVSWE